MNRLITLIVFFVLSCLMWCANVVGGEKWGVTTLDTGQLALTLPSEDRIQNIALSLQAIHKEATESREALRALESKRVSTVYTDPSESLVDLIAVHSAQIKYLENMLGFVLAKSDYEKALLFSALAHLSGNNLPIVIEGK